MKKTMIVASLLAFISTSAVANGAVKVPLKEANSIYKAAGFKKTSRGWKSECGDLAIRTYKDLNGDGLKDAIVSEYGSTRCYGMTAEGYYVIQQKPAGVWKRVFQSQGIPNLKQTRSKQGWPDILNGGPGFCFGVFRWDGHTYKLHRYEYEGKACEL